MGNNNIESALDSFEDVCAWFVMNTQNWVVRCCINSYKHNNNLHKTSNRWWRPLTYQYKLTLDTSDMPWQAASIRGIKGIPLIRGKKCPWQGRFGELREFSSIRCIEKNCQRSEVDRFQRIQGRLYLCKKHQWSIITVLRLRVMHHFLGSIIFWRLGTILLYRCVIEFPCASYCGECFYLHVWW